MNALNLAKAAARHKRSAAHLASQHEEGEACYLIGLAAECALKHHLQDCGFSLIVKRRRTKQKGQDEKQKDPLFLHFPELTTELLTRAEGIVAGRVLARMRQGSFFEEWTVRMRYVDQKSSPSMRKKYERWLVHTDALFAEVNL